MSYRRAWCVETLHHDVKVGWVLLRPSQTRADAWGYMKALRKQYPDETFRTVAYVPDGEVNES